MTILIVAFVSFFCGCLWQRYFNTNDRYMEGYEDGKLFMRTALQSNDVR